MEKTVSSQDAPGRFGALLQGGFREYYNPFSGEGYGAENFTWSGLVVDMLNLTEETK